MNGAAFQQNILGHSNYKKIGVFFSDEGNDAPNLISVENPCLNREVFRHLYQKEQAWTPLSPRII